MKLSAIFKIFQKGSKAAAAHKGKGKKGAEGIAWPPGIRIGVVGHANSGKTVYFTVLNEDCKISKKLQLSVTDTATSTEFLANYRALWGLGTSSDIGTMVDFRGEKKFPEPTRSEKLLRFTAIVDRKKRLPIVTYDYSGDAVAISGRHELTDKVTDFISGCDGLLFFYDPKVMGAELEAQARVASFVHMLGNVSPLKGRIPIPIAVVVSKADILPGFAGDDQVALVGPDDEYIISEDFELFLERMLETPKVAGNKAWSGSVRTVLVKMKDLLRVVVGRTLDFQVFFVSATGQTPEKIGTDVGRSLYTPPAKIAPVGVKEPFYWLLKSILRNKSISRFRTFARAVTLLSIVWMILYSLPFFYHFKVLYSDPIKTESMIRKTYGKNIPEKDGNKIARAFEDYGRTKTVKWFFSDFQTPAFRIRDYYRQGATKMATTDLGGYIRMMAVVVQDTARWPIYSPSDSSIHRTNEHDQVLEGLRSFQVGDSSYQEFRVSGRALAYWALFEKAISFPGDTTGWSILQRQVQTDRRLFGADITKDEVLLGDVMLKHKAKTVEIAIAAETVAELGDWVAMINNNPNPDYRLDTAVTKLQEIKKSLDAGVDRDKLMMIDRYLATVAEWKQSKPYQYKVESVPGDGHLHLEIVAKGKSPTWAEEEQKLAGFSYTIKWKPGDLIYVALDTLGHPEDWGRNASDVISRRGNFSIFSLDGDILFENIGKKVSISFDPPLLERLPKLE